MGKAARNEIKRSTIQYLNGIAVATIAAGCFGPLIADKVTMPIVLIALATSLLLHSIARVVALFIED